MDGRHFIDATTIGVLVALLVIVASILASRRKPVAPPPPRGDGIIVLECVQLEEHSRTAAAAAASTRWIRCHESFGANILKVVTGNAEHPEGERRRDLRHCASLV